MQDVERLDAFEDAKFLEDPEDRFALLDKRLSATLQPAATGELGRQLAETASQALREGRTVRGRELLRQVVRSYQTNATAEMTYQMGDLLNVKMKDPKSGSLEKFQNDWTAVRNGIRGGVGDDVIENIYYNAIRHHEKLAASINHYDEHEYDEPKHADRNFAYLGKKMKAHILKDKQDAMQKARSRNVDDMVNGRVPSAATRTTSNCLLYTSDAADE